MPCLEVNNIFKSYADIDAVKDISFSVEYGEIFGLLGPNGAGKTTTIRMLLDIIKPDKGDVKVFGKGFSEEIKAEVGYLPEERGLYENLTIMENILYIASLKGMNEKKARENALALLEKVGLKEFGNKRLKFLSKGMRQLVQLIATMVPEPKLLILDEPFSGLDPDNRETVKKIILGQKSPDRTIILSTHLMNEFEEMCNRVLMINHGRRVLYGEIADIKERYAKNCIYLEFAGNLPELKGLEKIKQEKTSAELYLRIDTTPRDILKQLASKKVDVKKFDVTEMSLNEIFIELVEAERWIKA